MRMMAHRSRSQVLPEVDGDATLYSARIATNRTSTTRRSLCRSQFGEIQQEPSAVVDADEKNVLSLALKDLLLLTLLNDEHSCLNSKVCGLYRT